MTRPVIAIHPPYLPELAPAAIDRIGQFLSGGAIVFEFGSGASTVWYAQNAGRVIYAEHDPGWDYEVRRALKEAKLTRSVRGILVDNEADMPGTIEPLGMFDLISVDCLDSQRVAAVRAAIPHLSPGGLFILDDSDWSLLAEARQMLDDAGFTPTVYDGEFVHKSGRLKAHRTTVYTKQEAA